MKIAFCNRRSWNNPLGGDGIQMLKTKFALEKIYGLDIDIITDPLLLSNKYDLVHIFNYATTAETFAFFTAAKNLNLKIVSSSIFWEYKYAITPLFHRLGGVHKYISQNVMDINLFINKIISRVTSSPYMLTKEFSEKIKYFVEMSNVVLPNSEEEGVLLLKLIGDNHLRNKNKIKIVYNGVDSKEFKILSREDFDRKYSLPKDFILQISRIQYLKNQLNLLKSMENDSMLPIVFVGKVMEENYYKSLVKIASKRGNVFFLPEIEHEDVYSFYRYAKVHVLLSFRESPGLVSLEALSQGCPVVVSDERFAPIYTYFANNDGVEVTNPLNLSSIRSAILKSYDKSDVKFDVERFSWVNVANQTYEAYKSLI